MMTLFTERLRLRRFRADDWRDLLALIVQYEGSPYAAFDHPWPTDPGEVQRVTDWFSRQDAFWAVCLKDVESIIGLVVLGLREGDGQPSYNLGFVFDRRYHGQGLASEACRVILARAFGRLQAERVVTGTAAVNQPAVRLLERLGFRKTGESLQSFRNDSAGHAIDFLGFDFALERERWEQANAV